ncbi:eIF5-mimic protein 2-like [Babylonia areolata]|uniref:eIF5-mimic protein 2-like n=1 Tax=Babylonia areolata TaxID=304850 RepID=UPI003FD2431B
MSSKAEKPTLSGTRLKTRKRDEKEKYDPNSFRDAIIQGLNETEGDLEKVSKFLDVSGSRLNYRRYAEVLFDVLFAGGILAPGGFIVEDTDLSKPSRTDVCVFNCEATPEKIKRFYEVFYKLIRRYKYLEKAFEDEVRKVLVFQKGFQDDQRQKLGIVTGQILGNGLASPRVLDALFEDHLVKEGISLECAAQVFGIWLQERDVKEVFSALKKVQIDTRLQELLPANKRSPETFCAYFRDKGLGPIADMQMSSQATKAKKEAQRAMSEMISNESPVAEMIDYAQELIQKQGMSETEVTITIWNTVMGAVEWNKKEDLVAEQAMKHLRAYTPLLAATARAPRVELALMLRVQEYCYENMNFLKSFQKIIVMLYKTDVLSEDTILRWHKQAHSSKGKSVFLDQMKAFVEWLENAEEESDEEEEG